MALYESSLPPAAPRPQILLPVDKIYEYLTAGTLSRDDLTEEQKMEASA